ncbi:hypothetical protein EYF80_010179 [Liparis tanakae]|uniref:Uncharacterized protein n=1 Tax=Liparis tanakae TaxID=230148 RepID=A0A4Z2IP77_9TELE|nr:hypothetical protein EYF80_010179 [Liparis tanakae]
MASAWGSMARGDEDVMSSSNGPDDAGKNGEKDTRRPVGFGYEDEDEDAAKGETPLQLEGRAHFYVNRNSLVRDDVALHVSQRRQNHFHRGDESISSCAVTTRWGEKLGASTFITIPPTTYPMHN